MKKAKKLLAMLLGVILVMGCLSVSAATEALEVKGTNVERFDGSTVSDRVALINGATFDDTTDRVYLNATNAGAIVYFDEGITEFKKPGYSENATVTIEYQLAMSGIYSADTQIQMHLVNDQGKNINDVRLFGGGVRDIRIYNTNASSTVGLQSEKLNKTNDDYYHFAFKYNPATKACSFYLDGEVIMTEEQCAELNLLRYVESQGSNIAGIKVVHSNTAGNVSLSQVKFDIPGYKNEALVYEFYEPFNGTEVPACIQQISEYTYSVAEGALSITDESSDQDEKGTRFHLSDEGLTGKYVVEMLLTGTTMTSNPCRVWFGTGQSNWYAQWDTANVAGRYWNTSGAVWHSNTSAANYNANSYLRIKAVYDSDAGTVDLYYNDIFVDKMTFDGSTKDNAMLLKDITLAEKTGTLKVGALRVYRPVEGLMVEEVEGGVKITSATEISAKLAAATYAGEGAATVLDSIAASDITLKPGVFYTVSTADYAGGNFYLWDSALKPLKAVLPIAAE